MFAQTIEERSTAIVSGFLIRRDGVTAGCLETPWVLLKNIRLIPPACTHRAIRFPACRHGQDRNKKRLISDFRWKTARKLRIVIRVTLLIFRSTIGSTVISHQVKGSEADFTIRVRPKPITGTGFPPLNRCMASRYRVRYTNSSSDVTATAERTCDTPITRYIHMEKT